MNLLELLIKVGIDDQATNQMQSVSAGVIAKGNILANAMTKVFSAVSGSMGAAISRVDTMNSFSVVMENMGVSGKAAQTSIDTLSEKLTGLPTALDTAVSGVKRFTSVSGDVEQATEYFLAMNNAIIAGQAPSEQQASAIEQLSQAYAKGKFDAQEWRTVQSAMPAQLAQIAQAFGTTASGLHEAMTNGEVSMDDFMGKIVELNEKGGENFASFEEQARGATGGIGTQMSNLNTAVTRSVANIIDAFNNTGAVNKVLTMVTNAINVVGKSLVPMATQFGEKVSEIADLLSKSMEPLAGSLQSSLSELADILGAVASAVVVLVDVLGPALPTIAKLAPVMILANTATSKLAGTFTNLATNVIPMYAQAGVLAAGKAEAMAASSTKLAAAIGGPVTLAITALVAILGVAAIAFMDAQKRQEEFNTATTGLVDASNSLNDNFSNISNGISSYSDSMGEAAENVTAHRVSVEELIQSQGQLAQSLQSQFDELNANGALLSSYSATMVELAGNCGGSAEKLAELQAAVANYNDLTGSNIQVIDEQTGALNASADAIKSNAAAWEAEARAEALRDAYKDSYKAQIQAEEQLAQAKEEAKKAQEDWNAAQEAGMTWNSGAADAYAAASQRLEELQGLADSAKQSTENFSSQMREAATQAASARGKVDELCVSDQNLANVLKGSTNGAVEDQAQALEAAVNELQAYQANVYSAQQKAFDNAYKAQQKAYSASEKALSRSLSKQYDAVKKSLDKKYNALKDRLDDELTATKKANEKQLSELKKSQDAQVKAFKAATKERIAAIDEEYEAQVALLELERDERADSIDAEINAIKAQTEAERKARKTAQNEQKRAELEKEAATGKTYKARKAAAEELQEFLADLEQERIEEEREALIESLNQQKDAIKEEASAKKEALQEERDTRKEQLTEQREAELEALQESLTAQYDALKESLAVQEEAMSESHQAKLEKLKESQDARLEAIREHNEDELEAVRESHSNQLEALKESQQAQLEALKASQAEQLEALKAGTSDLTAEEQDAAARAQQTVENATTAIHDIFAQKKPVIGQAAAEIRKKIDEEVSPTKDDAQNTADDMVENMFKSFEGGKIPLGNEVGRMARRINSELEGLPTDGSTAGRNFIKGFSNGMGRVDVWTAAWNIGINALNAIKAALGINSPSKRAYELFRQFDEGARLGIEKDAANVADSAREMAEDALSAASIGSPSLALDAGFGSFGEVDTSVSRAGVLISGNTFNVREEQDIYRVAEELATLVNRRRGAGAWSPAFTTELI